MVKIDMNKNNMYKIFSLKNESMSVDNGKEIVRNLQKLYTACERQVSEYGTFTTVKVNFKNKNNNLNVKDIVLSVKPSILLKERPKEREIEITVKSYNELNKYSVVLARGEKDEILKNLKDENIPIRIDEFIQTASEKFAEMDYLH